MARACDDAAQAAAHANDKKTEKEWLERARAESKLCEPPESSELEELEKRLARLGRAVFTFGPSRRRAETGDFRHVADPGDDPQSAPVALETPLRGAAAHRKPGARSVIIFGRITAPLDDDNNTLCIILLVRGKEPVPRVSTRADGDRRGDEKNLALGYVDLHKVLFHALLVVKMIDVERQAAGRGSCPFQRLEGLVAGGDQRFVAQKLRLGLEILEPMRVGGGGGGQPVRAHESEHVREDVRVAV